MRPRGISHSARASVGKEMSERQQDLDYDLCVTTVTSRCKFMFNCINTALRAAINQSIFPRLLRQFLPLLARCSTMIFFSDSYLFCLILRINNLVRIILTFGHFNGGILSELGKIGFDKISIMNGPCENLLELSNNKITSLLLPT